jgi:hypothetical protein
MTYARVVGRNQLQGDYAGESTDQPLATARALIAGDMRRLEADTTDAAHLKYYAELAQCEPQQVWQIFNDFFRGGWDVFNRHDARTTCENPNSNK